MGNLSGRKCVQMDFLKALMAYMAASMVMAVGSTSTPSVTPVPTPSPTPAISIAAETTNYDIPEEPADEATETPEATVSVTPVPVPTITPNTRGYHNLVQGDRGEEVKKLQERLIELGYLPEGSADGAYGGQTRMAVRRFQYFNGLTVDGIAGRTTQTNLFENPDAARYPGENTPEPEEGDEAPDTPVPENAEPTVTPVAVGPAAAAQTEALADTEA